jgi:hypothetical protein
MEKAGKNKKQMELLIIHDGFREEPHKSCAQ